MRVTGFVTKKLSAALYTALILGLFGVAGIGCSKQEVGTKNRPFTMYFVPSVDAETIAHSADHITDYIAKEVSQALYGKDEGFHIKSAIPSSYIAVVEAFGTARADFAALNTFSYILAKDIKNYDVKALVRTTRGKGELTYKAQFIAHKDSGIKSLEDLKGKRFAYTDPASTAGFIVPSNQLRKAGIEVGSTVFASKHDNVVTMIYQGQVDAGVTYYSPPAIDIVDGKEVKRIRDARARVKTQFPDVEDKVRIVAFSDDIPNEPWVIRSKLYEDEAKNQQVAKALQDALIKYAKTEAGKKALHQLYDISGLGVADDNAYAALRRMIADSDLDVADILRKKAAKKSKKSS